MKICSRCCESKDLNLFQIRKASLDGYTAACKKCLSKYDKERASLPHRVKMRKDYQKTDAFRESSNKANRKYSKTEKGKLNSRKWSDGNKEKRIAHGIVAYKVKIGEIVRCPCEVCGIEKSEAHHDDYEKPLEVRWLCRKHHAEHHKQERDNK